MKWIGLVLLVVLVLPVVAGSLDTTAPTGVESYGGKDRAGVAADVLDPLDVVGTLELLGEGEVMPSAFSQGMVATRHGLMAVAVDVDQDTCFSLHLDSNSLQNLTRGSEFPCDASSKTASESGSPFHLEGTTATAYDPVADQVLACTASMGETEVIRSLDAATGSARWGLSPQGIGLVAPELPRLNPINDPWYCVGISLDIEQRVGLAAVSTYSDRNGVVTFDLDSGEVHWVRTITPASLVAAGATGQNVFPPTSTRDGFVAWTSKFTDTGILITGALGQYGGLAAVWMDRAGNIIGWEVDDRGPDPVPASQHGAFLGAMTGWSVSGNLGSFALRDQLYLVEPTSVAAVQYPLAGADTDPADLHEFWPDPAWWDDHLLVALTGSLTNYDSSTGHPRWTLPNPAGWQPSDLFIAPPSDVYMLAARSGTQGAEAALFRIGIHNGELLHRLPLPGGVPHP